MTTWLVSFATPNFYGSQRDLERSFRKYAGSQVKVLRFRPSSLPASYFSENGEIVSIGRGFGNWLWKPWIIREALRKAKLGDLVFYLDSGVGVVADLAPLVALAKEHEIVLFRTHGHLNQAWTKRAAFELMGVAGRGYEGREQAAAGYQVYRCGPAAREFVEKYWNSCRDPRILTERPVDGFPELPGFREHRHDQSVLSLLAEDSGVPLRTDPSQFGDGFRLAGDPYGQLFFHHRQRKPSFWSLATAKKVVKRILRREA